MDPNANLQHLRSLAEQLIEPADDTADSLLAAELAEHVLALNEWITNGGFLPAQWVGTARVETVDPERTVVDLREWGAQHKFLDTEAEDSFDRGIGSIQWALAVESALPRTEGETE